MRGSNRGKATIFVTERPYGRKAKRERGAEAKAKAKDNPA
jgi:hypothetical protein